jgi:ABC-type glycerol-3-phosphate transport system permease component
MDEYLGKATIYYGRLGAAAVVGAIPGILFTALAGRELEKALTFGYVKG